MSQERLKGVICCYSAAGNTELACRYITGRLTNIEFEIYDITGKQALELEAYDMVGFACFTDFGGPSELVKRFIDGLPKTGKPAFVMNTYGFISGKTLRVFYKWVKAKGFHITAAHSLHTPESYPPMIVSGHGNEQAPDEYELADFNRFIEQIDEAALTLLRGKRPQKVKVSTAFYDLILPMAARTAAREDMGVKQVDEGLCTECGICKKCCPYGAIELDPKPIFDQHKCYGCWACFNKCPEKAIYTAKFRQEGHYPEPLQEYREKLGL